MDLQPLFYPKSIAVIGASNRVGSVGNDVMKNLITQGYQGKIFPINPKGEVIMDVQSYKNVKDVFDEIELAVVIVPAAFVPQVMNDVAEKKVKAAIIISAGFKETGPEGKKLEDQVKDICLRNNIVLIGPNCLGLINPEIKMNASFAGIMPDVGNIAFFSQSGALCSSVLDYSKGLGIGFSKFVSIGNKACLDEVELMNYLAEDPKTKAILMYVEQLTNGKKIIESVKKITQGDNPKPVIALKAGRTSAGAAASASHTGALGGDDALYNALFKQSGIIRASSVEELFDYALVFANNPKMNGKRVAIVTNAGGPGVLTTDEAVSSGLELAKLSESTVDGLKQVLPPAANFHNPIDVLGDAKADRYQVAIEAAMEDRGVDGVLVILTPQTMTDIEGTAQVIIEARKKYQKPIAVSFMGMATVESGVKVLRENAVAAIFFPEAAAKSMAALADFSVNTKAINEEHLRLNNVDKEKVGKIMNEAKSKNQTYFPEAEAQEIIKAYGLPLLKSAVAKNAQEAKEIASEFGVKVAMKIVSKDIIHKSDVGGVMLNIKPEDAENKFAEMMAVVSKNAPTAKLDGVLLMEMAPVGEGLEVVLGVKKDASLGHSIMFGMGGIYIEILKDVTFRLAPITRQEAKNMIQSTKAAKLFAGARGKDPLDEETMIECIGRLSQLVADFPQISELDMNPIIVLPRGRGVKVLDVRVVVE